MRSAVLTSGAAYWSSWADCLEMIAARNPSVADMIVTQMDHDLEPLRCVKVGESWFRHSQLRRTSLDPVARRSHVRGPLHVFPSEPRGEDRVFVVSGVGALSSLASFSPFLPQLPVWPST